MSTSIAILAATLVAASAALSAPLLFTLPIAVRPLHGSRGSARARARRSLFGLIEPGVRVLAPWIARWRLGGLRMRVAGLAKRTGNHLGLDANEWIALSIVMAFVSSGIAMSIATLADQEGNWWIVGSVLGGILPFVSLHERAVHRSRRIDRELPAAIDLTALCMGAGLDFGTTIARISHELQQEGSPLGEELARVVNDLAMGRTRREALHAFAERTGAPAVRDLVRATVQAERSGTPLAHVLCTQAAVLRARRSAAGEEAAARASVWLALPLVLLLCAILLVMLGPFLLGSGGLDG